MIKKDYRKVVVICGPTASGKTAFAIDYALNNNGVIINCDSQQVYADLNIITARPSVSDMSVVEHRLYGFLKGTDDIKNFSVAKWCELAKNEIDQCFAFGKLPILVGGTGFYISAIINGLSVIPDIDFNIRNKVRIMSNKEIYAELQKYDSNIAGKIFWGDSQRVQRALEVLLSTGKPLSYWQNQPLKKVIDDVDFFIFYKNPDKEILHKNIKRRAEYMLQNGAIDEVKAFLELGYDSSLPISKAIGVKEISNFIDGICSYDDMLNNVVIHTRQYAKRQNTWFRNQLKCNQIIF